MCTTELGAFAKLQPEFTRRGVKLIGLSANGLESHQKWIKDIDEVTGSGLGGDQSFPIIADAGRKVAWLYDMVDAQDLKNVDEKGTWKSEIQTERACADGQNRSRVHHPLGFYH